MIPFKSIRVGIHDIKLSKLEGKEADECLGLFKNEFLTIFLKEKYASDKQEALILLHELLHAMWSAQGIGGNAAREEQIVESLTVVLGMVIRDNPDLIEWLKESLS